MNNSTHTKSASDLTPTIPALNVMIDLECLGLTPGSKILQIGAVVVPPYLLVETGEFFDSGAARQDINGYPWAKCSFELAVDRCQQQEFHEDAEVIDWWREKPQARQDAVFAGTVSLLSALTTFSTWLQELELELDASAHVWSMGANFDIAMLEFAYRKYGLPVPWHYRNTMCHRTMRTLFRHLYTKTRTPEHTALSDAQDQAAFISEVLYRLSGSADKAQGE